MRARYCTHVRQNRATSFIFVAAILLISTQSAATPPEILGVWKRVSSVQWSGNVGAACATARSVGTLNMTFYSDSTAASSTRGAARAVWTTDEVVLEWEGSHNGTRAVCYSYTVHAGFSSKNLYLWGTMEQSGEQSPVCDNPPRSPAPEVCFGASADAPPYYFIDVFQFGEMAPPPVPSTTFSPTTSSFSRNGNVIDLTGTPLGIILPIGFFILFFSFCGFCIYRTWKSRKLARCAQVQLETCADTTDQAVFPSPVQPVSSGGYASMPACSPQSVYQAYPAPSAYQASPAPGAYPSAAAASQPVYQASPSVGGGGYPQPVVKQAFPPPSDDQQSCATPTPTVYGGGGGGGGAGSPQLSYDTVASYTQAPSGPATTTHTVPMHEPAMPYSAAPGCEPTLPSRTGPQEPTLPSTSAHNNASLL